jgi:replicative DNA helicase
VAVDGGHVVPIFSLEMSKESLLDRMICSRGRVNTARFDRGYLDSDERARIMAAASEITGNENVLIDETATADITDIHSKIRKLQSRGPVGLVIVDYLQLMIHGKDEHRVSEASRISRGLKLIAKDCKLPLLVLSQLSRSLESRQDKRPMLSDLRDSGAIEQDADVVLFIYREEVYRPQDESVRGCADLMVAKQRNGPTGVLPLVWRKEFVRFDERARA